MTFGVLGPLEVKVDGRLVAIGSRRQRAVLVDLLLRADEVVSTDRLVYDVWGERPPATASKALQVYISQLRRAIEQPGTTASAARTVVTRAPGYQLLARLDDVDARCFERLVSEGCAALAAGRPGEAATTLREALALWRGPPLGEFAFERFAQPAALRLAELHVDALETRIAADLTAGATGLVGELQALVREHPLRQRLRGQLMLALYRAGREPDALEAYATARKELVDELGIEPGPELQRLHQAILRQDAALEAPPSERAPHARSLDRFVGRQPELEALTRALDAAVAGRGSIALVGGEPGVGKTRLVEQLAAIAREREVGVLSGRCWEAGGAPAYWPWVEVLRAYVRRHGHDATRMLAARGAGDLAILVPELDDAGSGAGVDAGDGARFRLFDAATRVLTGATPDAATVVIVDDLQAADTPSLLLLRFLARAIRETHLLVVATYRDTEVTSGGDLAAAIDDLGRDSATTRLHLAGLDEAEIARLIEALTGRAPAARLAGLVRTETDGNPLYAGEMVRLLVAQDSLDAASQAGSWEFGVPDHLREVVGRRIDELALVTQKLLAVAAVLGREFRLDALELIAGSPRADLLDLLDEAAGARLTAPVPGSRGRQRFTHAVIRDVAYSRLSAAERRRLHIGAGEALEVLLAGASEDHSAELAHHFSLAAAAGADPDRAVRYATRAGERATRLLAFEEATRLFELALASLGPAADVTTRCDLLLAVGDARARAGDGAESRQHFEQAADLARRAGLPERLARAALGYGGRLAWTRPTSHPRILPLLDDALVAVGGRDGDLRIRLLARLAAALRPGSARETGDGRGGGHEAVELGRQAVELARAQGDPALVAIALEGHLLASYGPDDPATRLAMADEIIALGQATGDTELMFAGHDHRTPTVWQMGDAEALTAALTEQQRLADELRQPSERWIATSLRAVHAISQGRLDDGERLAAEALELGRDAQTWNASVTHEMHLFALRRAQGRLAERDAPLRSAARDFAAYDVLGCALAYLAAVTGRSGAARDIIARAAGERFSALPRNDEWLLGTTLLAEACCALRDCERAEVLLELLTPYAAFVAMAPPDGSNGAVARSVGLLALELGDLETAESQLRAGMAIDERMSARPALVAGQLALARALETRARPGDVSGAAALRAGARAMCAEFGLVPELSRPPR